MYQWVLESYKKVWEIEHMSILDTINNLDILYANQGKFQKAKAMYWRLLEDYKKVLGPKHI